MLKPIPIQLFKKRTGIIRINNDAWTTAENIVSLRELKTIHDIRIMPLGYLKNLLLNVTLGDSDIRPYENSDISTARIDPNFLSIGQTFIQRDKYQLFLEQFNQTFNNFCVTKGVAKCTALIIFGETANNTLSIAHYLPPIIEKHENAWMLLDGIHRNFLVKQIGTTLESILIDNISHPFPCNANKWEDIKIVSKKPNKNERYFNLKPALFRNLERVGIDG